MNKKDYQKPTMQVVELQQECHILAGSNTQSTTTATRTSYGTASGDYEQTWE